ncbi:MAG: DUF1566 domain-containing protein [Desulfuromonadales bacterium]
MLIILGAAIATFWFSRCLQRNDAQFDIPSPYLTCNTDVVNKFSLGLTTFRLGAKGRRSYSWGKGKSQKYSYGYGTTNNSIGCLSMVAIIAGFYCVIFGGLFIYQAIYNFSHADDDARVTEINRERAIKQAATEHVAVELLSAEQAAKDRLVAERIATERVSAERITTEERAAAELAKEALIYSDKKNGLMWARNGNIALVAMTWTDAIHWVKKLNYAGYSDWRLPTIEELDKFAKRGGSRPSTWFNANGFNSVKDYYYWSGTKGNNYSDDVCYVSMNYGGVVYCSVVTDYYVWPVRDLK